MKALLVVDMINDFIREDGKLSCGEAGLAIVDFVSDKIDEYREAGHKIVFICDHHEEDDKEFLMFSKHAVKGTEGSKTIDELDVREEDKVIYKRRYSSFFGTELDLYLREQGIDEISIVGVCTNICILYTTADARNLAYKVNVYKNGVASFDEAAHEFALKEIRTTLGANVI
ncbi:MAG: cysteine hydrolase [Firmicutes bacterium]|nr:cysteine hydrolase [Bacillota bacterium]